MQIAVEVGELEHLRQHMAHGCDIELAFARKVMIEQSLRYPRCGGYVFDGNRVVGLGGKEPLTHGEEALDARFP